MRENVAAIGSGRGGRSVGARRWSVGLAGVIALVGPLSTAARPAEPAPGGPNSEAPLAAVAPVPAGIPEERVAADRVERGGLALERWSLVFDLAGPDAGAPPDAAPGVVVSPELDSLEPPVGWSGHAWLRLDLDVAPEYAGRTLALTLHRHHGASRVYLEDRLVGEIGVWAPDPSQAVPALRPAPFALAFDRPGRHRLVVRFVNPDYGRYERVGYIEGFSARLETVEAAAARLAAEQRLQSGRRSLYAGVFLSFALLHLLLWAFRRESRENVFFALLCVSLATLAFLLAHKKVAIDPRIVFWSEPAMNAAGVAFAVCGALFVHHAFGGGLPRSLRWLGLPVAAILLWGVAQPVAAQGAVFLVMLAGLVEMARASALAVRRRVSGAPIVALGVLAVVGGFGAGLLALFGVLPRVASLTFVLPFTSILVLIVSMSIYLARRVARTHHDLELRLEEVKTLSAEKIDRERQAGRERTRRRLLEAEVEAKRRELEEARQLQLSMLPRSLPEHPGLEVATHMATATEVGGDYYDFAFTSGGPLTMTIGDATGHGLRAGTMVTATKSLFNDMAEGEELVTILERANSALKRMNLRALNMALLVARYHRGSLRLAGAGMPFPLVHRRDGAVETVELPGTPLGSLRSFPYREREIDLAAGESVLLMSDGFPELLDPAGEQLGYERAAEAFCAAAHEPASRIIDRLVATAADWSAGRERDDDVTFLVLKRR